MKGTTPVVPAAEYTKTFKMPYEREPVVIDRENLYSGKKLPGVGRNRGVGRGDTRLPVSAVLNGALGTTRGEIMAQKYPIGLAELTSRDNDAPAGGLSIDVGGVITTSNQRKQIIPTGSYVMVVPPTWDEIADGSLMPGNGNRANREGRIPWVYEVYRPADYNFYDDDHVRAVFARQIMVLYPLHVLPILPPHVLGPQR